MDLFLYIQLLNNNVFDPIHELLEDEDMEIEESV